MRMWTLFGDIRVFLKELSVDYRPAGMTSLRQGGQGYTHLRSSHRVGALYVHADAKRKWIRVYIGR